MFSGAIITIIFERCILRKDVPLKKVSAYADPISRDFFFFFLSYRSFLNYVIS